MFKLLKRLIMLAFVLVIAGAIGLFFIDGILAKGIEKGGSYALGVPVKAGSAGVGLTSGKVTVGELDDFEPARVRLRSFLRDEEPEDGGPAPPAARRRRSRSRTSRSPGSASRSSRVFRAATGPRSPRTSSASRRGDKSPEEGWRQALHHQGARHRGRARRRFAARDRRGRAPPGCSDPHDPPSRRGGEGGKGVLIGDLAAIVVQSVLGAVAAHGGGALPAVGDLRSSPERRQPRRARASAARRVNQVVEDLRKDPGRAVEALGGILGGKKKK